MPNVYNIWIKWYLSYFFKISWSQVGWGTDETILTFELVLTSYSIVHYSPVYIETILIIKIKTNKVLTPF